MAAHTRIAGNHNRVSGFVVRQGGSNWRKTLFRRPDMLYFAGHLPDSSHHGQ